MNRRMMVIAVLVLAAIAGAWWYLVHSTGDNSGEIKPTAQVTVMPLTQQSIAQTIEAFGVVGPAPGAEQVSAAPFDGLVRAIRVEVGARVDAGAVLLELAPSADSELAFGAAKNAQQVAENNLAATQERFDLKLATTQDLAVARQAADDARARVASLAVRGLGGVRAIRAGSAGVVTRLDVTQGALVLLGAPLASVATAQGLEARLAMEGRARSMLERAQPVMLHSVEVTGSEACHAQLRTVGAALDATSGSIEVRVPVPAQCPLLLGEHVRALIEVRKKAAVLVVPRSAVLPEAGAQVLYTVKDGKAVRHVVTVGIAAGDRLEVQATDLNVGDNIVVTGNYELTDGMAVQGANPAADQKP